MSFGRKSNARNPRPLSAVRKAVIGSRRVRGSYLAPTHPARLNRACLFAERARHRARASADGRGPRGRHRGPAHHDGRARFLRRRCACGNRLPRERRAHVRAKGRHGSAFPTRRVTVRCVPRLLAAATRAYTCRDARRGVLTGTSSCRRSCKSAVPVAKSEFRSSAFSLSKSLGAVRVFLRFNGVRLTISDEIKILPTRRLLIGGRTWQVAERLLVWTRA